jgi:hypothetical protein
MRGMSSSRKSRAKTAASAQPRRFHFASSGSDAHGSKKPPAFEEDAAHDRWKAWRAWAERNEVKNGMGVPIGRHGLTFTRALAQLSEMKLARSHHSRPQARDQRRLWREANW